MPPRKPPSERPLYVKLPTTAVDNLHRAAEALGIAKKDIVANLVTKYVDPDNQQSLTQLGAPRRVTVDMGDPSPTLGAYSFHPYDPPEVMNVEQAAQFLQVEEPVVVELAEAGQLPGRKLGTQWRFSRDALVEWLSHPQSRR